MTKQEDLVAVIEGHDGRGAGVINKISDELSFALIESFTHHIPHGAGVDLFAKRNCWLFGGID